MSECQWKNGVKRRECQNVRMPVEEFMVKRRECQNVSGRMGLKEENVRMSVEEKG